MNISIRRGFPQPKRQGVQRRFKQKTVVLVDFDGVVTNTPAANTYISDKITQIMKDVTGIVQDENVQLFNNKLYARHGHTWLGLSRLGYDITLQEFNDQLYGSASEYNHIHMTESEILSMCSFMMRCQNFGADVMLFSNADQRWLQNFMRWNATLYAVQDIVLAKQELLKPTKESYLETDAFLKNNGYTNVFFIDDKLDNLVASPTHWNAIWMNANLHDNTNFKSKSDNIHVCNNLNVASAVLQNSIASPL